MRTEDDRLSDEAWLSTLRGHHPQLTEKAVIDLVNGLEVVGDHLRCRHTPSLLVTRIWHALTGRTVQQQYLIDVNLTTGLEVATAWLQDLQMFQAKSDLALAAVAEKLSATRTGFGGRIASLEAMFEEALRQVHVQLHEVQGQVQELKARDKAKDQLELLLYHWETSLGRVLPPLVQVFLVIDELWWGPFGCYCRLARDTTATAQLLELARQKIAQWFADRVALGARDIIAVEMLLAPVANLAHETREIVSYLADRGSIHRIPLFQTIARTARRDLDGAPALQNLPCAFSPLSLSGRLLHESRRTTMEKLS